MTNVINYLTISIAVLATPILADRISDFERNAAFFASRLYKEAIKGRDNENVVFSPLSVQTALGLTYLGTSGNTSQEIAEAAAFAEPNPVKVAEHFHDSLKLYKTGGQESLQIANKIYAQSGFQIRPEFITKAQHLYSEAEIVNFADRNTANNINRWVEGNTNGKIRNLFSPNDLDSLTRMVIVNAVYFKGVWETKFNHSLTQDKQFWINPNTPVMAKTMSQKLSVKTTYIDTLRSMAIQLPYRDSDLSMVIILPTTKDGLRHLENEIANVNLLKIVRDMHVEDNVRIEIPKFKIDFKTNLNQALQNLGIQTMFTDKADFRNLIDGNERIQVSDVVHKAFIDVDEEGTEAAASTGIGIQLLSANTFDRFIADHPFFYAIVNERGVVFAGRVVNPLA